MAASSDAPPAWWRCAVAQTRGYVQNEVPEVPKVVGLPVSCLPGPKLKKSSIGLSLKSETELRWDGQVGL